MNKKQFFMLSLLVCPLLHEGNVEASVFRKFLCASVALAVGMEIYVAGEYNKTLPLEEQTRLAKEGHPYLDATLGMVKTTTDAVDTVFVSAATQLEKASTTLQDQREVELPNLIKKYNPFAKKSSIEQLETILEKPVIETDVQPAPEESTRALIARQEETPDNASGKCSHS